MWFREYAHDISEGMGPEDFWNHSWPRPPTYCTTVLHLEQSTKTPLICSYRSSRVLTVTAYIINCKPHDNP
jgi:hypothetical protein